MKKNILLAILIFLVTSQVKTFSQCNASTDNTPIQRGVLAGLIFEVLFEDNNNVYDYDAAYFPNPFIDLQEDNDLNTKLKVLSYLQYNNGLTVYNYTNDPSACFKVNSTISKIEALIYVMEAWNILPDYSGSNSPFNDIPSSSAFYGYVKKAVDENIIEGGGNFNPASNFSVENTLEVICKISNNSSLHPVSEDLTDIDNYFIPGLYSPNLLSQSRGLQHGVFNHYAKNSFSIPDRKLNLNFSHFYSSSMVELPEGFFPIKPLGRGWSHTYNAYVIKENNVGPDEIDYYYIVWADGTIHIFNEDDDEYVSLGVYDDFDELSSGDRLRITKKSQVRYYFERLDNDREIWYLNEIKDPNGNSIEIEYENAEEDDTKRIEWVESPSGKKLTFNYINDTDYIDEITDPIGRKIQFDLDEDDDNRLEDFIDAKGYKTRYRYVENDANAPLQDQKKRFLLDEIKLPRGNEIKASYDDNNAKLSSYTIDDNDPIEVNVEFDYENDEIKSEVTTPLVGNSNGFSEKYTFNKNNVVTNYENDIDEITIGYPTSSSSSTPLLPTEINTNGLKIEYDFDNKGNVEEIDIEEGKSIKKYKYDSDNNITEYTDPEGNVTKFSYDSDENLIEIEDALGNSIIYTYDNYGQLLSVTNQEGITIQYTYENDGAVATIIAPEGISSSFDYDGINRLLSKTVNGLTSSYNFDDNDNLTSFTNTGGYTTSYDYNSNDNIVSITNTNNVATVFAYNDKDQVISVAFGNLEKTYRYNDDGSLDRFTKPSSTRIDYDYDDEGRLEEVGTISNIEYNNRNLIDEITNDTGTMEFRYDNLNRLDEVTTVHGYKVEYDYEKTDLLEEIEYPTINGVEFAVEYNYDKKNRVASIELHTNDGNNNKLVAIYDYKDDDRLEDVIYDNQIKNSFFYDDAGRLDRILIFDRETSDIIYQNDLTLDTRGNIINSIELLTEMGSSSVTFPDDEVGINTPGSSSYNDNNHAVLIQYVPYTVNNDGNTTGINTDINFEYDIHDRLTKYQDDDKTFDYKYNAYGQRVDQIIDGISHKYVRDVRTDNVLMDIVNGNVEYYYIYTPSRKLVARMTPNGELSYYHSDIRGSTIAITNEDREITHKYRYDDFGKITKQEEPETLPNRYKYVGTYGVETDDNDLYYMRARYYTPSAGRFLTEDPVWSTNLYPYADNNPISKIDPNGKYWESAIDAAFLTHSYIEWDKDPSLLNSAALAFDGVGAALPIVAGLGTGLKVLIKGEKIIEATGQIHHLISNKISRALDNHPALKGAFDYGRKNLKYQYKALNEAAHKGYQKWHRKYDDIVVKWIQDNPNASVKSFDNFLHNLHQQDWLKDIIPNVKLK
jgi:RHS repeat-associated protein